jgi:hypothetical protein
MADRPRHKKPSPKAHFGRVAIAIIYATFAFLIYVVFWPVMVNPTWFPATIFFCWLLGGGLLFWELRFYPKRVVGSGLAILSIFYWRWFTPRAIDQYEKDHPAPTKYQPIIPTDLSKSEQRIIGRMMLALDQKIDKPYRFKPNDFQIRIGGKGLSYFDGKTFSNDTPIITDPHLQILFLNNSPRSISGYAITIFIGNDKCSLTSDSNFWVKSYMDFERTHAALTLDPASPPLKRLNPGDGTILPDATIHCEERGIQQIGFRISIPDNPTMVYSGTWHWPIGS